MLDRFHVIRWFQAGLTAVRRDLQRREPPGAKPAFEPDMFGARFALLRRGDTLTDTDPKRLKALFDAHPRLRSGSQALQQLHGLYLADDHHRALEALDRLCDLYETGELPEYHDIVDTIIAWSDEILASHHTNRPPNARIEGIQQPAASPPPHRPRLHQPHQPRSPRHPRDIITPTDASNPSPHVYAKRQLFCNTPAAPTPATRNRGRN